MEIGQLRDRISIEARVNEKDAVGAVRRTWVPLYSCAARIETKRGREFFTGDREESAGDALITFRYPPRSINVDSRCRILDVRHGIYYAVASVMFDDQRTVMKAGCLTGVSDG